MNVCTRRASLIAVVLLGLAAPAVSASQDSDALLTPERIYDSDEFRLDRFGPARWLDDGSGYTLLEDSRDVADRLDIVRYRPETGEREILVDAMQLVPEGADTSLTIDDYGWSSDGTKALIYTNSTRVWRTNSRGDYWVLDLETGRLSQVGRDFEPSTLMFATFSPDDSRIAYVNSNNIYVENLATGGRPDHARWVRMAQATTTCTTRGRSG